jgi:histidinol-phosphate phosphatase family protein
MGVNLFNVDHTWTLFLDRDGVINQRIFGGYVLNTDSFEFEPGVMSALKMANQRFGKIIVVTNQQCVALGLLSEPALAQIHQDMITEVFSTGGRIDAVYAAIDLKTATPNRRKPNSAMALEAQRQFPEIDFSRAVMVGDTDSDIRFGRELGMRTVLVESKEETTAVPDLSVNSLLELMNKLCA